MEGRIYTGYTPSSLDVIQRSCYIGVEVNGYQAHGGGQLVAIAVRQTIPTH